MSYKVLARKWRPKSFQELTGQEHVSKTLENAIQANRIAHAYLFSGVRGVGKTTVARILAKSLNCAEGPTPTPCMKCQSCLEITGGFSVDVIEIDGASNTGVDNVRELQEKAQYMPFSGRHKIYIIDEVHMLSTPAFNALLKILEEPPPHIVFIFATTEPHKIPATIHSRCQHFPFRRISYREIVERLHYILQEEGITASEDALSFIARASDGSMRDALSLLDQVIAYTGGNLSEGDVSWILGLADHMITPFFSCIVNKDSAKALSLLKDVVDGGYDLKQFCANVVEHIRNLTLVKLGMGQGVIDLPEDRIKEIAGDAEGIPAEDLQRLFGIFSKVLEEIKWFSYPRFSFEMAIIKAANMRSIVGIDEILGKLAAVEKRLENGHNEDEGFSGEKVVGNQRVEGAVESASEDSTKAIVVATEGSSDISALWHNIVTDINGSKPSLGSYLEQGLPVGYDNGILTIGFNGGASVFIDLIERKESKEFILKMVKKHIPDVAGIKFTTTVINKGSHSPAYNEYMVNTHEKRQQEIEDAFSEPILKEAIDILNGELIELRSRKDE